MYAAALIGRSGEAQLEEVEDRIDPRELRSGVAAVVRLDWRVLNISQYLGMEYGGFVASLEGSGVLLFHHIRKIDKQELISRIRFNPADRFLYTVPQPARSATVREIPGSYMRESVEFAARPATLSVPFGFVLPEDAARKPIERAE